MQVPTSDGKPRKSPDIRVLRCLGESCRAMLAYEVDSQNHLYVDLSGTARQDEDGSYFPCPTCGGRNYLESVEAAPGRRRSRVAVFRA